MTASSIDILSSRLRERVNNPLARIKDEVAEEIFHKDDRGQKHRSDGPVFTNPDGSPKEWWIHGHNVTNEVNNWMKQHDITYPWDAETQFQFELTIVHVDRPLLGTRSDEILARLRARSK